VRAFLGKQGQSNRIVAKLLRKLEHTIIASSPSHERSIIKMKVQTAKRMVRLQEWATQINDCKQSGKSVKQWCREIGLSTSAFYNRMRIVREEMLEMIEFGRTIWTPGTGSQEIANIPALPELPVSTERYSPIQEEKPIFAALPIPQAKSAAVTVRMGGYTVDIQNGADDIIVEQVLRVVSSL
jgi:hypothetical protein